jgi:hypothetical protein
VVALAAGALRVGAAVSGALAADASAHYGVAGALHTVGEERVGFGITAFVQGPGEDGHPARLET